MEVFLGLLYVLDACRDAGLLLVISEADFKDVMGIWGGDYFGK
jgi:hypothetical protein